MPKSCSAPGGSSAPRGRELKSQLVLAGLRVPDVAAQLGMSRDTLYRVLRDERVLSDDERASFDAAIAAALVA